MRESAWLSMRGQVDQEGLEVVGLGAVQSIQGVFGGFKVDPRIRPIMQEWVDACRCRTFAHVVEGIVDVG